MCVLLQTYLRIHLVCSSCYVSSLTFQLCVCLSTYSPCASDCVFCIHTVSAPFLTSVSVFVRHLDLTFPTASAHNMRMCGSLRFSCLCPFIFINTCGDETLLFHPLSFARAKNNEGKKGGGGEFNQACVKIACGLSWSSRERGRQQQQPAEERKDVCSYAHQQGETQDEERQREGDHQGRGSEEECSYAYQKTWECRRRWYGEVEGCGEKGKGSSCCIFHLLSNKHVHLYRWCWNQLETYRCLIIWSNVLDIIIPPSSTSCLWECPAYKCILYRNTPPVTSLL